MKKGKNAAAVILNILLGVIAALIVLAAAGYLTVKFYIVPRYTQKLADSGHEQMAEAVERNANLSSLAALGSALADRGVLNLLTDFDKESAKSVLEVLGEMEEEYSAEADGQNSENNINTVTGSSAWSVADPMPKAVTRAAAPTPAPTPAATAAPEPAKQPATAYERIAAVATAEEMSDGLKILSKIDMGYVSSLTAGGLTPEEKSELKKYVYSRLSSAEISRAMALYKKYSKYL